MSSHTLLPGVDHHNGAFRVRLSFRGRVYSQAGLASPEAANALVLHWREMRKAGLTPEASGATQTLAEAAEALLERKRTLPSRYTKRQLRAKGLAWWTRSLRPWREGPLAARPLNLLRRNEVEDLTLTRALAHPTSARNELDALKATLRLAQDRGQIFDRGILAIERPAVSKRRRQALSEPELELLASLAPVYARNLLLVAATTGARMGELFTLTDDRADLEAGTLSIPAEFCKEARDKTVALTAEEIHLLRVQLLSRAPGTNLVFPTLTGKPWRWSQFQKLVWYKTRAKASQALRTQLGASAPAETVFDTLTPHDLRATAATFMRDAGLTRQEAADRLGHADEKMLDQVYDQGDRSARVAQAIAAKAPQGFRAAAKIGAATTDPGAAAPGATGPSRPAAMVKG